MKKYQLWLERKSYSQHLFNLMKIKNSNSSLEKLQSATHPLRSLNRQRSTFSRYKELQHYHQSVSKLGDISYAITYKQLKNRKLRIMKTFEIMNQNMNMSRRVNGVKSVLKKTSKQKTLSGQKNNKRKLFEKKCELSNEEIREENFKKFIKWQNNRLTPFHRFCVTLTVQQISKIMTSHHDYAAIWCQITTDKGFIRSDLIPLEKFQGHKLFFSHDTQFPKDCLFKLYVCKGLESQFVGQCQFQRPEMNLSSITNCRSDDGLFQVTFRLSYNKVRKEKFLFSLK